MTNPNHRRYVAIQLATITVGGLLILALTFLAVVLDPFIGFASLAVALIGLTVLIGCEIAKDSPPSQRQVDREFWRIAHQITNTPYVPRHPDRSSKGGDR